MSPETRRRPAGRGAMAPAGRLRVDTAMRGGVVLFVPLLLCCRAACGGSSSGELRLIYAGSMIVPFDHLATQYAQANPG